jgi:signal transduction histidine kinase
MLRRISTKLTLAASIAISVVTIANALQRYNREASLFEADIRRDHQVLGTALAETTGALSEGAGVEEALLTLEAVNQRRNHVEIHWVLAPTDHEGSQIRESAAGRVMETRIRVPTSSGFAGYIELTENLAPRDRYRRDSIVRIGVWALFTIFFSAILVHIVGLLILERPLRPITAKIQRVGQGDLEGPLGLERRDELGIIGRELDEMCTRLSVLQRKAGEETEARIAALEQLRHADRLGTVGMLASGVAHELGTPLNVVLARAQMIARGESEGEESKDDARVIVEQTERMTRIIRQLLDFARRRPPSREPVDLRELASSIVAMLGPLADRHGVEIALRAGTPVLAEVDVGQMQQVLTNLAMNAIQAQPEGGRVELAIEPGEERVTLSVSDEGPGMPPEVRERAFEPFFTTKEVGRGTGLGLSVVHGMVEEHGGQIELESEPGRGTRVVVSLPKVAR